MSGVRVGAARRDVTVPDGTPMAGFAARGGPSEGVHDPLTVRALAFDDAALVIVDVCALHERTCARVRDEVGRSVIVTATHTHSGPCVSFERLGQHADAVHEEIVRAVVEAVTGARAAAVPCRMLYGEASGGGVARNRRHENRMIDPPVQILAFEEIVHAGPERVPDAGSRYVAHLVTYPCHPVVLDGANRLISGDYPAYVRESVEEAFPGSLCLFATGCAGDVNTGHSAAASFTPTGGGTRTFAEAERIGRLLGDAVAAATLRDVTGSVSVRRATVPLALEDMTATRVAEQRAVWAEQLSGVVDPGMRTLLRTWIEWADRWEPGYAAEWPAPVSVFGIGAAAVVALPGEPFWETACRIRARLDGPTLVLGYADGVPGYIPPADEYVAGGYEVCDAHRYYAMPAPFAAGSAERLEEAVETIHAEARHDH